MLEASPLTLALSREGERETAEANGFKGDR